VENLFRAKPENDCWHVCIAQPTWRQGLSSGIQHTASDTEVILGIPGMREMSRASQVSPLTAQLSECTDRGCDLAEDSALGHSSNHRDYHSEARSH